MPASIAKHSKAQKEANGRTIVADFAPSNRIMRRPVASLSKYASGRISSAIDITNA